MKRTLYAIRFIFLSFGLAISSWASLIPIVKSRFQFDDAELGLALLISGIGALISMPVTGWIMNKIGSRLIILFSGIGLLASLPILSLVHTTFLLCLALFFFGIAGGAMNVSMNAQAVDIEIKAGLPILSGIHCWFSSGGLFGPLIIGLLMNLEISVYFCFLTLSTCILFILLTQCHQLLSPFPQKQNAYETIKTSFLHKPALLLGCLCFIAFMAEGAMLDWSAEYLRTDMNYDVSVAGLGYSAFSIAMAIGRFFGDRMIKRFGTQLVFRLGCFATSMGFLTVITAFWTKCELFGFMLIGFGASNIVPILFSCSGKLSGISSNSALAIVTTCGYIGLLVGPTFIGFLAEATNLSFSFLGIALLLTGLGFYGKTAIVPALAEE